MDNDSIPLEDWTLVRLADICSPRTSPINPQLMPALPYVGLEHLDSGSFTLGRWGNSSDVTSSKILFEQGDVLYGKLRPYLDKAILAPWRGVCSTEFIALEPNRNFVLPYYLACLVHSTPFIRHAVDTTGGTNLPRTSWSALKTFTVFLPPIDEQRAIAHVLRTVQRTREATAEVVEATRTLKQSLMKHLFTYGPVPVGEADRVESQETEIGPAPVHWKLSTLGNNARLATGGTPSREKPEFWGGEIPWVKTGEINYQTITSTEETITQLGFANSNTTLFPRGTLLTAIYGQGVTRGRVARLGIEATTNQACCAMFPKDSLDTDFLYYTFVYGYERIRELGHGANQRNLSMTMLKDVKLMVPPLSEQKIIASMLSPIDNKLSAETHRRDSLDSVFQSLLHLLMTGQVRVHDLDVSMLPEVH